MLRLFLRPQQALIAGGLLVLTSILLVHTIFQPNYAELVPGFGSTQNNEPILEDVDLGIAAGPLLPEEYREQYPSLTLPQSLLGFPKLHEKLHAFLSRPVYSYEEGKSWNENHCPREISDKLVNPDQLNGDGDFWRHDVTPQVIRQKRADLVNHLADLLKQGETVVWPQSMELEDYETEVEELQPFKRAPITQQPSRGIVTTGGNADTTARLITLLRFLRNEYHVTLPVEVWAFPGELRQGSDQWRDIEALNGQIREVPESYHLVKDTGAWKNFQIKGLAIALSSFQELIYLDSDNIPLRDPTCLFETESYTKEDSGKAVFWPDLSKDHVDNAIWRVMGTPCTLDDFTFESYRQGRFRSESLATLVVDTGYELCKRPETMVSTWLRCKSLLTCKPRKISGSGCVA
jgi:alpha 1,2-mannosyltransferase